MRDKRRTILWLAAWLVLGLPLTGFAQNSITVTCTTAMAIGPTSAVGVWSTAYVGPQTIQVGALGLCTASCTIGLGGTCGGSRPVLTGCAGGMPFPILSGAIDIDTLTLTQIRATQITPQPVPLGPWLPVASAIGVALLAIVWRLRRVPG